MENLIKKEVEEAIQLYEQIAQISAQRTRNMIKDKKVIPALSSLVKSLEYKKGFKVLRDAGKLDKTFEAIIMRYPKSFEDEIVKCASFNIEHPDFNDKFKT